MNRRRISVVASLVVVVTGFWFFLWVLSPGEPEFRLKVVRQAIEQGKPVIFFKVVGGGPERIQLTDVERVAAGITNGPFDEFSKPAKDFWAPSQTWPMGNPNVARKEFGIVAPTNTPVWKLLTMIYAEAPATERFKAMPRLWRHLRKAGSSFPKATRDTWNAFYGGSRHLIESDLITNSVLKADTQ